MKNLNNKIKLNKTIENIGDSLDFSTFDKNLLHRVALAVHEKHKSALYLSVDSVSRSGMSRTVSGYIIYDNSLYNITWILKELKILDKAGRIHGCGMDMLFEVSYSLFLELWPKQKYQDNLSRYRTI